MIKIFVQEKETEYSKKFFIKLMEMESNMTVSLDILEIQGFDISPEFTYPLFFLLLFFYFTLLFSNIGVLILIITEKSLHQPMYILFCNLSVNDLIGNTVLLPRLMAHIISTERFITYNQCAVQAFYSHTFGSASHMILIIMAIDRYVAICHPLRYSSIMTTKTVMWLSATAWGVSLLLVSVLIGLTVRLSRCRSVIQNAYCDNASLFKLSCDNVSINNIYGLFFTVLLFSCSIGGIAVTYFRIALNCWIKKNKELNSKALQTCASHLVLYLIMLWSGFLTIILHRFPDYPDLRKIAYILFHVVPANLNPLIYGMQTRSLRDKIFQILKRKVTAN
ncbi:olfactory receptor 5B12-like isoform X2 [Dicentrarchus labrax]|uniref:G-protein coupled receptors family 1 profile domain-containing protein n=2 Tax=Dicentrarchus labrax TaxID=13489 RepID=A0A8C4FF22_DICLA|nr:olfactory receptor 5B12-like isoform X2 [Dicentrarchus labrax]XP_051254356.1 olfactory receptor 5B12-like isoform X2 [Dicentrarchus labrax]